MKIRTLPDDVPLAHEELSSPIIFYHFTSLKDSVREMSHLGCNAFSLVVSGAKTMLFAEKKVQISDREIHLLSSGNCIASVTISEEKKFESVLIFFSDEVLSDFFREHSAAVKSLKRKNSQPFLEFEKDEFIVHYIESLLLTLGRNKRLTEAMKKVKFHELLLYLLETYPEQLLSFRQSEGVSDAEMKIRKVMEVNKDHHLSVDELAFLCDMSVSTFKRHFKSIYQTTPANWLNDHKMRQASVLLRQRKEKPGEIWHQLGFETHTGFTKSFKKYYGCTPKDYSSSLE